MLHVIHRDRARKEFLHAKLFERMAQFAARPASEESKLGASRPPFEKSMRYEPSFAPDVAARSVRSPIDILERALHLRVFDTLAQRVDPLRREPPVVVVTVAAFPLLNVRISEAPAGEMLHRVQNGAVIGTMHVDENSVDVEDHQFGRQLHHSSFMVLSNRFVCAVVPAVMRMKPSRPNSDARSRTRIPRRANRFARRVPPMPKSASTKFAPLGKTRAPNCSSPRASRERLSRTSRIYACRNFSSLTAASAATSASEFTG